MLNDKPRLFYLDAIRGIAALMVVFSHYNERTPVHKFWLFEFFTPGQFGVVVFFILSGFVIPYSFEHSKGNSRSFLISRFFRLYPAYWLSVLLAAVSAIYFLKSPFPLGMVVANLTMVQKLFGYSDAFGTYWTLFIELIFYGLCVALSIGGVLSNLKFKFYLSISFLFLSVITAWMRNRYNLNMPVGIVVSLSMMLFGSVWRDFIVNKGRMAKIYSILWILVFLITFPIVSFSVYDLDNGHGESAFNYIGSFFLGVLFFVLLTTKLKIENKVLVYLGAVSYSMYLLHPFVLEFTSSMIDLSSGFYPYYFLLYIFLVLIMSSLSYFLVEKPAIRIGRKMRDHLNRLPPTANIGM
ncbi:acyltransferase [Janthinobacterium sp. 75]|uniref:acyltransferase family protein n=1 Tax=Janthinobacterium sp. 75 TaxID=2135628 RepID=UPI001062F2D6|nr:acyltransferase [Janthinobacterium sp. 75]TDY30268.1 peptidoglycan/LPS O-acetylase OafA/YrhL [Janthinobacterium sp. 75]